jgi:putative transposase
MFPACRRHNVSLRNNTDISVTQRQYFARIIFSMANTYTQLYNHIVFATKYRRASIQAFWQEELHRYITGIVQNHDHKMLQINSMPDHIHMFIGMKPHQSLSNLVQIVKSDSSKWINAKKVGLHQFAWQEGFGAFSYSKSLLPKVILYIQHQQHHHRKKTFREEYVHMLNESGIDYDERYIFKDPV